jgi:cyclophilin family peptidyl-prolyl cis-trans isomerase/HEAT repeat protein
MKKAFLLKLSALVLLAAATHGQAPPPSLMDIVKAEDARAFTDTVNTLLSNSNPFQVRAALAAGRIGDERAITGLSHELEYSQSVPVRSMSAFALGEIESIKAADILLKVLADANTPDPVRARIVEAAGKIAAANAKDPKAVELGKSIVTTLETENTRGGKQSREVVLSALTAALRVRPDKADAAVARFLTNPDARVRADAGNTMARLRGKNANEVLRRMARSDADPVVRANAARALGAADDKDSVELLLNAAVNDSDLRVRVSAVRTLGALKDPKAAPGLAQRGEKLVDAHSKSKRRNPTEQLELFEIAAALGRMLPGTEDNRAVIFINKLRMEVGARSAEAEIALAQIAPEAYVAMRLPADFGYSDPLMAAAYGQGMAQLATSKDEKLRVEAAEKLTAYVGGMEKGVKAADDAEMAKAMPELIRSIAAFKPSNLSEILAELLTNEDVFIRTAAAELIAEQPASKENLDALKAAFSLTFVTDKAYDDAQLAILDALVKLDKREAVGALLTSLNAPDYLLRKKAMTLLSDPELQKDFPGIAATLEEARAKGKDHVSAHTSLFSTKLGQILNTKADYIRALSRKNGTVKAVLTTEKGTFTINLFPEDAPLTVDNFIKLARSRYFNGVEVHRVVPNFVMQDGDPRGDGNGGPGWSIRCEINMLPYDRGAVGMALSGKDTGGSQWFVTHSPQPHLDGGYTVFGHVNETGMKVVDNIVRGDRIISVRIVEGGSPQRTQRTRSRK